MIEAAMPIYDATDSGIKLVEDERRRLARDLHDGPAQALTNLSMRMDIIAQLMAQNPQMAVQELQRTNSKLVAVINDIRRLIYDLRPVAIDEVGFISAAEELCRRCAHEWSVPIFFTTEDHAQTVVARISPAKQLAMYRLVQEILQNMNKHAQATEMKLLISAREMTLCLMVEDNGVGFNPSEIPVGHYGLIGMKERSEFIGGRLTIDSGPGRGSRFELTLTVE